jgi:hypothetical protein
MLRLLINLVIKLDNQVITLDNRIITLHTVNHVLEPGSRKLDASVF